MKLQSMKNGLRRKIKDKLKEMTETEKLEQSNIIVSKLLQNQKYKHSRRIAVYLSMKNEVQTETILSNAIKAGKEVFVPRYIGANMDMLRLHSMEDYSTLPETSWKIKQPADDDDSREDALLTGGLDLIVVPGVGFTLSGNRLGHGKGYYDIYIEKASTLCVPYLIGLAFGVQICSELPVTLQDKRVDEVLTTNLL